MRNKIISITKFHSYVLIRIFLPQLFILIFITHHRKNDIFRDILRREKNKTKQQMAMGYSNLRNIYNVFTVFMMLAFQTVTLIFVLSLHWLRGKQESKSLGAWGRKN